MSNSSHTSKLTWHEVNEHSTWWDHKTYLVEDDYEAFVAYFSVDGEGGGEWYRLSPDGDNCPLNNDIVRYADITEELQNVG